MALGKLALNCLAVDVALSPQSITPFCDFVFFRAPKLATENLFHSDRIAREPAAGCHTRGV
jgi:hypothetical protein